jgi:uncharacterized protein
MAPTIGLLRRGIAFTMHVVLTSSPNCGVLWSWRMSRILFFLAVIIVVYLLLKRYRRQAPKEDISSAAEEMVRCAQCGVHLPKSESLLVGGNFYCCDAHRREHTSK